MNLLSICLGSHGVSKVVAIKGAGPPDPPSEPPLATEIRATLERLLKLPLASIVIYCVTDDGAEECIDHMQDGGEGDAFLALHHLQEILKERRWQWETEIIV